MESFSHGNGRGRLRIAWLLEEVSRHGRCQSAILELWTPPADSIEATIEKEALWAEESLRFLKPSSPEPWRRLFA